MRKIPVDTGWEFVFTPWPGEGRQEEAYRVDLPHDYIIGRARNADAPGGASNGYFPAGSGAYTKTFTLPEDWPGGKALLYVDGAYMNAEVLVNGEHLAVHPYGYTPFWLDISGALRAGGENTVRILTQSCQPSARWYSGGGLYREVSLYLGPERSIDPFCVYVAARDVTAQRAVVTTRVEGLGEYDVQILDGNGAVVAEGREAEVAYPRLWDTEAPYLYRARITAPGGDVHEQKFGIRSIDISVEKGFLLNGRPIKLRGGCVHHDNGMLGAAAWPAAEERKVRLLKAAGYNAIRSSHYPPSAAMLEACDRLGMLVMDEAFDVWMLGKKPMDYHLYFRDWWERDIASMVLRDRCHPCVFCWSIGNEIPERSSINDGYRWAKRLAEKVRSLDPYRPVTSALNNILSPALAEKAAGAGLNRMEAADFDNDLFGDKTAPFTEALDIAGYNYLWTRYAHDLRKPIIGTESLALNTYDYWMETLAHQHVIGDFIWTAFDYLGEAGLGRCRWEDAPSPGLLGGYPWHTAWTADFDITGWRRPQSHYRQILWGLAKGPYLVTAHPGRHGLRSTGEGWEWPEVRHAWDYGDEWLGKPVAVQAYTADSRAEFLLNGRSLGTAEAHRLTVSMDIPYEKGVLEVRTAGGADRLHTPGAPAAIRLSSDKESLRADGRDIAFIAAQVVDAAGHPVEDRSARMRFEVSGRAGLMAVGSGDPRAAEPYAGDTRMAFEGRLAAAIRSGHEKGEARVACCLGSLRAEIMLPVV